MPDSSSTSPDTLYDPPEDGEETASEPDNHVSLQVALPSERADKLRTVAQQLGLTPSTLAERAIELVCDEVVTIQADSRSSKTLIQQYQARVDLLHSVDSPENGRLEPISSQE